MYIEDIALHTVCCSILEVFSLLVQIDQKGKEKEICEMFGREIQGYDNGLLRYVCM